MKGLLNRLRPVRPAHAALVVASTSRTHLGRVRSVNEDRVLSRPDLALWAVADGMGGQARGDLAADAIVRALAALPAPVDEPALERAFEETNREIFSAADGQSGSTLVLLHLDGPLGTVHWAGDSRAYLIRDDRLILLTRDHSVVQELIDAGLVEVERAADHPQANLITRALGTADAPNVETLEVMLAPGDRILLCSDGLSRSLVERDVSGSLPVEALADRLLTNALQRDGTDNITLALIAMA